MKSTWRGFKSVLSLEINRFLTHKRALGRRFKNEEDMLRMLDRYLASEGLDHLDKLTPPLLENFLASRPRKTSLSYNRLRGTVARFLNWLVLQGYLKKSPLTVKPRRLTIQRTPFIFDLPMVRRLLDLSESLPDTRRATMRGKTYRTIFALLYGLGLRVGEVCRLCLKDMDEERQLLVIRKTKFLKDRLVPFGPRLGALLDEYLKARIKKYGILSPEAPLFSFGFKHAIRPNTVSKVFHNLVPFLKLEVPPGFVPPHVHHLRHSFAVGTLLRWYRAGINPQTRLVHLSTFLGHADLTSSAVYLSITDNLLEEANQRFENFARMAYEEEKS